MPDWLLYIVGVVSGLAVVFLQMRHERGATMRTRMLEAADDFVAGYASAREALAKAIQEIEVVASLAGEDKPDEMRRRWQQDLDAAIRAAREACDALRRRQPRIQLLFERNSPAAGSSFRVYADLSVIALELSGDSEVWAAENGAAMSERLREADRRLDEFSRRARDAILASPWTMRPIVARARMLGRRARERMSRLRRSV